MQMPSRIYSTEKYRYGFNGKEKDKDINSLTAYDYGFRIYNTAIGRFLSIDPLKNKYPELTPYQFASNRVIDGIDLDGLEYIKYYSEGKMTTSIYRLYEFEHVPNEYTLKHHIWVTNAQKHGVIMNHPDNIAKPKENVDDNIPETKTFKGKPKDTRMHNAYNEKQRKWANRNAKFDIAGGVIEFVLWIRKISYEYKNSEVLNEGRISIISLDKADKVVRAASSRADFPDAINDEITKRALVNYMTDGYLDPDFTLSFSNIVIAWGNLLINNGEKISEGRFLFAREVIYKKIHKVAVGTNVNVIVEPVKEGNSDVELNEAWKLLDKPIEKPKSEIKAN